MPQSFSILKVHGGTIFSSCSDGQIYLHSFPEDQPHYDMAETENSTSVMINRGNGSVSVSADPEQPTELCEGPKRCKTGKTGLVKSSSSFQVSKISIMFNFKCASQSWLVLCSLSLDCPKLHSQVNLYGKSLVLHLLKENIFDYWWIETSGEREQNPALGKI